MHNPKQNSEPGSHRAKSTSSPADPLRTQDAGNEWPAAAETLAAFIGAVFGVVGYLGGVLSADHVLMVVAGLGAAFCAIIWAGRLAQARSEG